MKYRKKVKWDEAFQWFDGVVTGVVFGPEEMVTSTGRGMKFFVVTVHDQHAYLTPGDWVITEPDGVHYYPCQDTIFRDNHEDVPPAAGEYLQQGCPVVMRSGKVYSAIPKEVT